VDLGRLLKHDDPRLETHTVTFISRPFGFSLDPELHADKKTITYSSKVA
jgi:hypothetical protein